MESSAADPPPPAGSVRRRNLAIGGVVAVAVAIVALLTVGLANRDTRIFPIEVVPAAQRVAAPPLALPLLRDAPGLGRAGQVISLARFRGRPVVVNFWAGWCVPCKQEAPLLRGLAAAERGRLVVLGVNVQQLSGPAVAFAREERLNFPLVRDGSGDAWRDYRLTGVPETFVIDRGGRLAAHIEGPIDGTGQAELLRAALQAVA